MLRTLQKFAKQIYVTTYLMDKKQLQEVENLDLWSVSPEVKGISKVYVAVMNTDRVFRI